MYKSEFDTERQWEKNDDFIESVVGHKSDFEYMYVKRRISVWRKKNY